LARPKRKWPVIAGVAFIAAFIAWMAWSTFGNSQQSCTVCVTYNGRTNCGTAAASSREQAERTATDLACNDLGHGMTELMQCQNASRQVTWKQ
jgi:hypothetical protein